MIWNWLNNIKNSQKMKSFLVASVLTILTFLAYIGQGLYSDTVTFAKEGDQMQLCYSSFVKLGNLLKEGLFFGVDSNTSNGATDFFLRAQIPVRYLPIMLFALAGTVLNTRLVYLLFYAVHLLIALYFAQRLGQRFFNFTGYTSVLFAASCMPVLCHEMWYSSHAIITFLVIPLFYFSLSCLEGYDKRYWIFMPMPYVLAFTAGYITLAVALVVVVMIAVLVYGYTYKKNDMKWHMVKNVCAPFIAGAGIVFLYYVSILIYIKSVVKGGSYSMPAALEMKVNIKNLAGIIFSSFNFVDGIEQISILTLGTVWVICIFIWLHTKERFSKKSNDNSFLKFSILLNVIFLVISCGNNTPMGAWFYSALPILGQTHLPIRYMMITLPFLYLALCVLYQNMDTGYGEKKYLILFWCLLAVSLGCCFVFSANGSSVVNEEKFILEVFVTALVMYLIYRYGWKSGKVVFVWSSMLICIGVNILYQHENILKTSGDLKEFCIVYDEYNKKELDRYLSGMQSKDLYRFVHLDSQQSVTSYIPGNYGWFDISVYPLMNYIGMDIHTCLPQDYRERFSWFDIVDWKYLYNTRADFIIADEGAIDQDEQTAASADWEHSTVWLNNRFRVADLKKYIPDYYTDGKMGVSDILENVLDNGYFYCPYLTNDQIRDFRTDGSTYFTIGLETDKVNDVAFLLYPNRNYVYYLDGERIQPHIYESQAFLTVPKGIHTLSVQYENRPDYAALFIMGGYIFLVAIYLGFFIIYYVYRLLRKDR